MREEADSKDQSNDSFQIRGVNILHSMTLSNTQYHQAYIKALKPNGVFPSTDEIEVFDETTFKREEQEEKV